MKYDYVFVGAGPANLAAANLLFQEGVSRILILEQGAPLSRRNCPGRRANLCTHCNGNWCHVTGGEGGSSAHFGNKLCYFPASNRILKHFPDGTVSRSINYLKMLLGLFFVPELNDLKRPSPAASEDARRKDYASDVLLKSRFEQLIRTLLSVPGSTGLLQTGVEVAAITRTADSGFRLITDTDDVFEAKRVVLGCGRSSHAFLRRTLSSLGVSWKENCQDVGLRLEAPACFFSEEYSYQADPKYKFSHSVLGTSRTFCACNGGIIVPVKFGGSYYAEGAFVDEFTENNNLAFMVRSHTPVSVQLLEDWCAAVNLSSRGSLFLGEVCVDVRKTSNLVAELMRLVPRWPGEDHRAMMTELLSMTLGEKLALLKNNNGCSPMIRVYGPAVDLYWPQPKLGLGLETDVPGLFVLGDVTGVSRGFVQAMVSGVAWAFTQLPLWDHPARALGREVEKWSVSV